MITEDIIFSHFPHLGDVERARFAALGELYRDWNSKINVISRKDIDNFYLHHVLHSLSIAKYIESQGLKMGSVIDVGTGGGFPGIPLAILYPDIEFTLCDSIAKKIKVVDEVAKALGLQNVTTHWGRCEQIASHYDYVVSRAVTELKNFMPLVEGLYRRGIIYLKGGDIASEIESCQRYCPLTKENILVRDISEWFNEDYFLEKKIIHIKK